MTLSNKQKALLHIAKGKLNLSDVEYRATLVQMASFAQLELVRVLWCEYTGGNAGEDELNKWLLGTWKISSLRFLRKDAAQKVITALKAMKARAA